MEQSRRQPLRTISKDERYGQALLLLAVFYLLSDVGELLAKLSDVVFILILLLITVHPLVPIKLRQTAIAAAILSALLSLTRYVETTSLTIGLDALSDMVVVGVTIVAIMIRLVHHRVVTASTVMGAFLCYALIGFAASDLYIAVDAFGSESFFTQGAQPDSTFIYFSLVTLTTVGFGDFTAGTDLAQRLVAIEALAGQVFLVVLVARLVSLWKPPAPGEGLVDS